MDDEQKELIVSPEDMLDELNIDTTATSKKLMAGLIQSAQELITDAVNTTLNASTLAQDPIYIQAVKALSTALYYDRTLSGGFPLGVQMMITHLQGRYDKWPDKQEN